MSPPPSKIDFVIDSILMKLRAGALRPGQRLPSIRDEAELFGVGKNTVVEAYLRLVGQGMSNAEIAAALYITAGTAKTHVARLLAKLDARDRIQLVITAYETGLVPAPH